MLRNFTKQIKYSNIIRYVCSYTEPSIEASKIYDDVLDFWKKNDFENAEIYMTRAIRIKENRGDRDLDEYKLDLESIKSMEECPY